MDSFKITLPNGNVLTGLHNLHSSAISSRTPLLVALHGGSYTAKYFDVDENHTASFASNGLRVPFVAINRPGYLDSTSLLPIPKGSNYPQEYGAALHRHILPALWTEFGQPNGCNSIILLAHSLGTTGAIIAAGLYAKEIDKTYPLAGISFSGFGTQVAGPAPQPAKDSNGLPPPTITFPPAFKDSVMLQEGHADPSIYQYTESLNHSILFEELDSVMTECFPNWAEWAARVEVPVMVGVAGHDLMWKGTEEHLKDILSAFTGSSKLDGALVTGAPHNMEMSYWSRAWYARCFGFALECATLFSLSQ